MTKLFDDAQMKHLHPLLTVVHKQFFYLDAPGFKLLTSEQ
jgi:hypothetical protein